MSRGEAQPRRWLWRLVRRNAEVENPRDERRTFHCDITRSLSFRWGVRTKTISKLRDRFFLGATKPRQTIFLAAANFHRRAAKTSWKISHKQSSHRRTLKMSHDRSWREPCAS